ncbi:hypothetical protein [Aquicella lusitana]|uniref:DUF4189 domain-containing protein n=1 Tax=Aquicella lusitana TaxID=254246 RepID=A0A370G3W3_9COXI|nr:hypothetical protein [Aquicella lusitana]RDI38442.1 hypothetical protein C8D86_1321 [Aquicella lusitana]VVC73751.1 hypothetical protein AQULUS_15000 [Aquicella lusitana]
MKTLLWKIPLAITLAFVTFSAHAAWRCEAGNSRGHEWTAVSNYRSQAARLAMQACRYNSSYRHSRTCRLNYCRYTSRYRDRGAWQCNVADRRGRAWYGMSNSRQTARSVAYRYCRANSTHPRSCYLQACFRKW